MSRKVRDRIAPVCGALALSLTLAGAGAPGASAHPVGIVRCTRVTPHSTPTKSRTGKLKAHVSRKAAAKPASSRKSKRRAPVSRKGHRNVVVTSCAPTPGATSKPTSTHAGSGSSAGAGADAGGVAPAASSPTAGPVSPGAAAPAAPVATEPSQHSQPPEPLEPSEPTPPSQPSEGGSSSGDQILSLPLVNPFSPASFWNAPLAPVAPIDPNSQAYVDELLRQVQKYGTWMNTYQYSVPVYVVGPNQPTQHVTLDVSAPDMQAEFDAVPIPSTAQAAAGTDEEMTVWQPSTDKLWEFWKMQEEPDGWHARWGGEMDNVSTNPGYFTHSGITNDWGATATGLPLLGGLVTEADLQRGYINHALAISLVETEPRCWSWPAQRTDGAYTTAGITPIPEGARFRLNPAINVASLNLPPLDEMLAQAAQTYGIVVRDKGGSVAFLGEDPKTIPGSNPWSAEFEDTYASTILAKFPWSDLQTLQTQMTCAS